MPNPLQAADIVGHSIRFSELGLTNRDLAAGNVDLTAYKTAVPETVIVLVQLASGGIDVQVQATAAGTFSSGDATTSNQTLTAAFYGQVCTTSVANPYVNVRLVVASGGARIAKILVLPLAKLTGLEDWFNVRDGVMAVASGAAAGTDSYHNPAAVSSKVDPTSDGSGTFIFDYTV